MYNITMDTKPNTVVVEQDPAGTYPSDTVFFVDEVFMMRGELLVQVRPDSPFSGMIEVFGAEDLGVVRG